MLKDEDKAGLKTTGLDDENEVKEEAKPEAKPRGRPKNSKNKAKRSENAEIMEMMMLTDRLQAKRERAKERRQSRKDKKNMKLLFGMLGLAMNTFAPKGKKPDQVDVKAVVDLLSSDSESMSSIDTTDSPPTKRLKLAKQKKKEDAKKGDSQEQE